MWLFFAQIVIEKNISANKVFKGAFIKTALLNLSTTYPDLYEMVSIVMEVTVRGMDATVEPIGTYSRRVTGMTVLNSLKINFHNKSNS